MLLSMLDSIAEQLSTALALPDKLALSTVLSLIGAMGLLILALSSRHLVNHRRAQISAGISVGVGAAVVWLDFLFPQLASAVLDHKIDAMIYLVAAMWLLILTHAAYLVLLPHFTPAQPLSAAVWAVVASAGIGAVLAVLAAALGVFSGEASPEHTLKRLAELEVLLDIVTPLLLPTLFDHKDTMFYFVGAMCLLFFTLSLLTGQAHGAVFTLMSEMELQQDRDHTTIRGLRQVVTVMEQHNGQLFDALTQGKKAATGLAKQRDREMAAAAKKRDEGETTLVAEHIAELEYTRMAFDDLQAMYTAQATALTQARRERESMGVVVVVGGGGSGSGGGQGGKDVDKRNGGAMERRLLDALEDAQAREAATEAATRNELGDPTKERGEEESLDESLDGGRLAMNKIQGSGGGLHTFMATTATATTATTTTTTTTNTTTTRATIKASRIPAPSEASSWAKRRLQ